VSMSEKYKKKDKKNTGLNTTRIRTLISTKIRGMFDGDKLIRNKTGNQDIVGKKRRQRHPIDWGRLVSIIKALIAGYIFGSLVMCLALLDMLDSSSGALPDGGTMAFLAIVWAGSGIFMAKAFYPMFEHKRLGYY
jgi:hypothetical protein